MANQGKILNTAELSVDSNSKYSSLAPSVNENEINKTDSIVDATDIDELIKKILEDDDGSDSISPDEEAREVIVVRVHRIEEMWKELRRDWQNINKQPEIAEKIEKLWANLKQDDNNKFEAMTFLDLETDTPSTIIPDNSTDTENILDELEAILGASTDTEPNNNPLPQLDRTSNDYSESKIDDEIAKILQGTDATESTNIDSSKLAEEIPIDTDVDTILGETSNTVTGKNSEATLSDSILAHLSNNEIDADLAAILGETDNTVTDKSSGSELSDTNLAYLPDNEIDADLAAILGNTRKKQETNEPSEQDLAASCTDNEFDADLEAILNETVENKEAFISETQHSVEQDPDNVIKDVLAVTLNQSSEDTSSLDETVETLLDATSKIQSDDMDNVLSATLIESDDFTSDNYQETLSDNNTIEPVLIDSPDNTGETEFLDGGTSIDSQDNANTVNLDVIQNNSDTVSSLFEEEEGTQHNDSTAFLFDSELDKDKASIQEDVEETDLLIDDVDIPAETITASQRENKEELLDDHVDAVNLETPKQFPETNTRQVERLEDNKATSTTRLIKSKSGFRVQTQTKSNVLPLLFFILVITGAVGIWLMFDFFAQRDTTDTLTDITINKAHQQESQESAKTELSLPLSGEAESVINPFMSTPPDEVELSSHELSEDNITSVMPKSTETTNSVVANVANEASDSQSSENDNSATPIEPPIRTVTTDKQADTIAHDIETVEKQNTLIITKAQQIPEPEPLQQDKKVAQSDKQYEWSLNLISIFKEKLPAQNELDRIKQADIPAEMIRVNIDGKVWYRLRITGFSSYTEAKAYLDVVKEKTGIQKYWISRRTPLY